MSHAAFPYLVVLFVVGKQCVTNTGNSEVALNIKISLNNGIFFLLPNDNNKLCCSSFRDNLVSLLNCLSAGVFFATFFLHMMPDVSYYVL